MELVFLFDGENYEIPTFWRFSLNGPLFYLELLKLSTNVRDCTVFIECES